MLRIPLDRLPDTEAERRAVLRDYFCDKDAAAVRTPHGWELSMFWPSDNDRHVDPNLSNGLRWWGDVENESMAFTSRRQGRMLTCLYDTLTLQSWCEWWHRRGNSPLSPLLILHVDDHRDLGSPRLFIDEHGNYDAITGNRVSMTDPDSVSAAISSGAIGMGSFLTPFLGALPGAEVRHLCQPPKAKGTKDFILEHSSQTDSLIDSTQQRPIVQLRPASVGLGPGTYRITQDLSAWLDNIPTGPTLLHIDMDYFNNRYDGDSGWQDREELLNPDFSDVAQKIKALGDALRERGVFARIEDAVVAYSPGFFPAEFWQRADGLLREHLAELYAY